MKSAFDYINEMNRLWFQYTPNEWKVKNLGHVAKMIVPMRDKPTSFDGTIPWIRIEDFDGKYISDSKSNQYVSEEFIKSMNLKVFPKGTVMCTCSCTMGATAIVEQPLVSNQTFIGIVPGEELNSEYLYYLMQASADRLQMFSQGAIQQYLSRHNFEHLKIPLPSTENQKKIVDFLNNKLENLDKLIQNKNNLLKLLEQQRQSIITEAVTKGLNPNVKMKDSGVEWIGEIPEHWEKKKLKYIGQAVTGLTYSPEDLTDENGIIVLRSTNIQKGRISLHDNVYVKKEIPEKLLTKKNDILICSRNGSRQLIGKNALITNEVNLSFGAFTTVFRSDINEFLYFVLNSNFFEAQLGTYLTSTINQLTIGNLNSMEIVLPSKEEQAEIINYLREIMDNYNELINKIEIQIEKLKEYRQALIYEAVTGKIDVRELELD